jgi:hypothetical protein
VKQWVAVLAIAGLVAPASADDAYIGRIADQVRARLDALVAARAPKLVPPVPVAVKWKAVKAGNVELRAPLLALVAGELDGDRRAGELYAVTPREVIAIGFANGKLVELGRVPFTGDLAVPAPRDPVGTAIIENTELVAAASPWAYDLRVAWQGKKLVAKLGSAGFLVCPNERVQLAPGKNHFTTDVFNVKCRNDLVDAEGHPLQIRAELATSNKLSVIVKRCAGVSCTETGRFDYPKVGIAFEIADVDRDGTPELLASGANPPGSPDAAKVLTLGGAEKFKRMFNGGVAGLAFVDGDDADDIPEVIAAVRLPGATRIDLWRLD